MTAQSWKGKSDLFVMPAQAGIQGIK